MPLVKWISAVISETVARRRPEGSALGVDAGLEPTGMYLRRVSEITAEIHVVGATIRQ